mgnify:CR=1 FL=1
MPAFLNKYLNALMDVLIAFDLVDVLAVGVGVLALIVSLVMPMSGSDHSDRYGLVNYVLAVLFVAVTAIIATPMIWYSMHGIFYSFCFCLAVGGFAAVRWNLLGQENTIVVKNVAGPNPGSAGEGANGSKKSAK